MPQVRLRVFPRPQRAPTCLFFMNTCFRPFLRKPLILSPEVCLFYKAFPICGLCLAFGAWLLSLSIWLLKFTQAIGLGCAGALLSAADQRAVVWTRHSVRTWTACTCWLLGISRARNSCPKFLCTYIFLYRE